jgi:radical SAM protein with 4Fe4S-binding SPASM domain
MSPGIIAHIPARVLFQWHVTERCNLKCTHCYQDDTPAADPAWHELTAVLDQFISFIVRCRNAVAGRPFHAHVTVTGGEPFLRDDFPLLLERLSGGRELFSFAILTNGTLLSPATVRILQRLNPSFVQVSIDGTPETHNRIRGATSYERAVTGLKELVRSGIPAYISFTAHRGNYRDFPSVARLARRLGAARVWSDRMVPCGRGYHCGEGVMAPEETREYIRLMDKERKRGRFWRSPVFLHRSLQFTATGNPPYRCCAGDTLVTVLPNGDVCPCRRMPLVVGNIHRRPLDHIYENSELFRNLRDRDHISKGCERCFYARTCGGGSRCLAWAVHGDPFHADPGCWLTT